MDIWLRARRVTSVLAVSITAYLLLVVIVQNVSVFLPSILGSTQVALSLFVPIPLLAGLMLCLDSRIPAAEVSGVRRIALLDAGLISATTGTALIASIAIGWALDLSHAATCGRNTLFLAGLMLCGRSVMGQRAVMVPVAWLFIVVLIGFRSSGDPYPWTILPEPIYAVHAAAGTALAFITGIAVHLRTSRRS